MNLELLRSAIRDFRAWFGTDAEYRDRWVYPLQERFAREWTCDPAEIGNAFANLLWTDKNKRYWKQQQYEPRRMMLAFLDMDPDFASNAFADLFDEEKDIEGRIDRFQYYADEMLRQYRERNPLTIDNNHYQDHRIISLYLSLRHPDRYTYYDPAGFQAMMTKLGSPQVPVHSDPARYFKVARVWMKFLNEDPDITRLQAERLESIGHVFGSLWIVHEFVRYSTIGN